MASPAIASSSQLATRRHDGDGVQQVARLRRESRRACQDCVADGRRNRSAIAGERFGDEERVSRGLRIEIFRIDAVRPGELGDGFRRERLELQATARSERRQVAEHDSQGVRTRQLVAAIGGHHQRAQALDPATE